MFGGMNEAMRKSLVLLNVWLRYGLALILTSLGSAFVLWLASLLVGPKITTIPHAFLLLWWMRAAGFLLCVIGVAVALVHTSRQ